MAQRFIGSAKNFIIVISDREHYYIFGYPSMNLLLPSTYLSNFRRQTFLLPPPTLLMPSRYHKPHNRNANNRNNMHIFVSSLTWGVWHRFVKFVSFILVSSEKQFMQTIFQRRTNFGSRETRIFGVNFKKLLRNFVRKWKFWDNFDFDYHDLG